MLCLEGRRWWWSCCSPDSGLHYSSRNICPIAGLDKQLYMEQMCIGFQLRELRVLWQTLSSSEGPGPCTIRETRTASKKWPDAHYAWYWWSDTPHTRNTIHSSQVFLTRVELNTSFRKTKRLGAHTPGIFMYFQHFYHYLEMLRSWTWWADAFVTCQDTVLFYMYLDAWYCLRHVFLDIFLDMSNSSYKNFKFQEKKSLTFPR